MRQEIHSLTSLRGIAALVVLLVHFQGTYKSLFPSLACLDRWVFQGLHAVTLFFILSGYVIGMIYFERMRNPSRIQILRFISLRFARIYPVHLFTLLCLLAAAWNEGWPKSENLSLHRFVENLLLIQSWGPHPTASWNYPAWSISSEWFVYCTCPLIFWSLHRLRGSVPKWILLCGCAAGTALVRSSNSGLFHGISQAIFAFTGGILLSVLFPPLSWKNPKGWVVWAIVGSILLIPVLTANPATLSALLAATFFLLIGTLGAGDFKALPVFLYPPVIYLGDISYSLYLTHVPTLTALSGLVGNRHWDVIMKWGVAGRLGVLLGYLAALFLVAALTHLVVERPARDWFRNWIPKLIRD